MLLNWHFCCVIAFDILPLFWFNFGEVAVIEDDVGAGGQISCRCISPVSSCLLTLKILWTWNGILLYYYITFDDLLRRLLFLNIPFKLSWCKSTADIREGGLGFWFGFAGWFGFFLALLIRKLLLTSFREKISSIFTLHLLIIRCGGGVGVVTMHIFFSDAILGLGVYISIRRSTPVTKGPSLFSTNVHVCRSVVNIIRLQPLPRKPRRSFLSSFLNLLINIIRFTLTLCTATHIIKSIII